MNKTRAKIKKKTTKKANDRRRSPDRSFVVEPDFVDGQQALLWHIMERFGGPSPTADLCGLDASLFYNWRSRGKIPLQYTKRIAEALGVSAWGLNYADIAFYAGHQETWRKVVRGYGLPGKIVESIMYLAAPKVRDWE